ncbi:MAG: hypothetical protein O6761_03725 [Thaumarchaeota archaeon]|nr:hypothetical protein [Nitrososphaerota archaeon]
MTRKLARISIQIREDTHKKLVKKRGLIEAKTGIDATFDDVINELLDQAKKRRR